MAVVYDFKCIENIHSSDVCFAQAVSHFTVYYLDLYKHKSVWKIPFGFVFWRKKVSSSLWKFCDHQSLLRVYTLLVTVFWFCCRFPRPTWWHQDDIFKAPQWSATVRSVEMSYFFFCRASFIIHLDDLFLSLSWRVTSFLNRSILPSSENYK